MRHIPHITVGGFSFRVPYLLGIYAGESGVSKAPVIFVEYGDHLNVRASGSINGVYISGIVFADTESRDKELTHALAAWERNKK